MPLKELADTGIEVSALGLGTVKLGRNQEVKYPKGFEIPDDRHARNLLAQAAEAGINLLDTAPAYGVAEERLGNLIGNNHYWVVCTKVGEHFQNGVSTYVYTEKETRLSVENSLRRLRREVLDIVLIHSNGDDMDVLTQSDVLETLRDLQSEGKIRAVGISSKTVEGGLYALKHMDLVMCTYNLAETEELPVIEAAARMNKGIFIKKGLMSGHLDKTDDEEPLLASYRHIFAQPGVTSLIIGTINPKHLQQNIDALNAVNTD
ncbi:MAG: aldo/keto reductase [Gammaproteobacteria bacterium]|nr:MAG: aldo/keto reductase [Gammaproteobacteria bacterium]